MIILRQKEFNIFQDAKNGGRSVIEQMARNSTANELKNIRKITPSYPGSNYNTGGQNLKDYGRLRDFYKEGKPCLGHNSVKNPFNNMIKLQKLKWFRNNQNQ